MSLCALSITEARRRLDAGEISSTELVEDCLKRVEEVDGPIQAWAHLNPEHAKMQAAQADDHHRHGRPPGPLHGIPIAVKDIYDTSDYPTEFGSPIWAGRTPRQDATAVAKLREAGAVIMGKTVTTEFAYFHPGKTRNPHDPSRTPGGSSSGSAAAVASYQVPGALGSQTNGSMIRPAAYCGVVGFKPTHGLISRAGVLPLSRTLDQLGAYARSVEDAALLAETMVGFDEEDLDTRPVVRPPFAKIAASDPPLTPRIAFVRTPVWDHAEPVMKEAFGELVENLGEVVSEVELGPSFERVVDMHRVIMQVEMAHNLRRDYAKGKERMSAQLRDLIEQGRKQSAIDYVTAVESIRPANLALEDLFNEFDAILTPPTTGEAPKGEATGSPIFCTIWTYLGTPAVSLPILQSEAGLPLGVQMVGKRNNDARLLRTANWLMKTITGVKASRKASKKGNGSGTRSGKGQRK